MYFVTYVIFVDVYIFSPTATVDTYIQTFHSLYKWAELRIPSVYNSLPNPTPILYLGSYSGYGGAVHMAKRF